MPDKCDKIVCSWCIGHQLLYDYHNSEWGIPLHDDKRQFEYLTLEVMQCGLSWLLMLKKRESMRKAFADFDYRRVAEYTEKDIREALSVPDMIKSDGKIRAVVNNAKIFMQIQDEFGSFDNWIWSYTNNKTYIYKSHQRALPASNGLSEDISGYLRKRGMKYLGPVTVYSHLQAAGIINDHEESCYMYKYINENFPYRILDD